MPTKPSDMNHSEQNSRLPWELVKPDPVAEDELPVPGEPPNPRRKKGAGKLASVFPPEVKTEVAIEALKGNLSQREISAKFNLSQPIVSQWRRKAIESIEAGFRGQPSQDEKHPSGAQMDPKTLHKLEMHLREAGRLLESIARQQRSG